MTETAQRATDAPLILQTREASVLTIKLNRPERLNALDHGLARSLVEVLNHAAEDKSVRALVLTGAGRAFCSGGDLYALHDIRERSATQEFESQLLLGKQIVLAIVKMSKPVLAAVNGPAMGAGCNLALACGLRIASQEAMFAQSFVKLGLCPDFGGTYFLPRIVGVAAAAQMLYTGNPVSAEEGLRIGLVSRVVPQEHFSQEATDTAAALGAAAPIPIHGIKQMLFKDDLADLERALDEEIRWQLVCFRSDDFREGLTAFFEKRSPRFHGQ